MPSFAIRNLIAQAVVQKNPWDEIPPSLEFESKSAFREWQISPSTDYVFYSMTEGINPHLRVTKTNPAFKIHGIIADYDAKIDPKDWSDISNRGSIDALPSYVHRTFSGGARAVWIFEKPVFAYSKDFTKKFLAALGKELRFKSLFPALDPCFQEADKYYALGDRWTAIEPKPLRATLVNVALHRISDATVWKGDVEISMDILKAEVDKVFPGRWLGDFRDGASGVRFWDADADCQTGCVVRATGMQCFTGLKPFVSWKEIFGHSFVRKFEESRIGEAVARVYHDGTTYWRELGDRVWKNFSQHDVRIHLRVRYALSDSGDEGVSEVDRAMHSIQELNRVEGAIPLVFRGAGEVLFEGRRFLNTATVRVLPAAEAGGGANYGEFFPWLAKFFDHLFDPTEQRDYFFAEMRRFYLDCVTDTPSNGHVIFIAGDTGIGKTLLSTKIVGGLVGGSADASEFLLGREKFPSYLFEKALWSVDDTTPSADSKAHSVYTAILKKIPANTQFVYNEKFKKACMLPWQGRIIVTLNNDAESLRILPDAEQSLLDKIVLLKCASSAVKIPRDVERVITEELPYFARWLMDWEVPNALVGPARYGVVPYHHPDLLASAGQLSVSAAFVELLEAFFEATEVDVWRGTATELKRDIAQIDALATIAMDFSTWKIGKSLSSMAAQGLAVTPASTERRGRSRVWEVRYPLQMSIRHLPK